MGELQKAHTYLVANNVSRGVQIATCFLVRSHHSRVSATGCTQSIDGFDAQLGRDVVAGRVVFEAGSRSVKRRFE